MKRWTKQACLGLAVAVVAVAAPPATAELNLWISYHFAGQDSYGGGDYHQAERLLLAALSETRTRYRRASTLDTLGRVYLSQGRFDEGEKALQEALALKERSLGRRHRQVPVTLNHLADLRYLSGKGEVESLYRRALAINERDQLNEEVSRSLNGLALVHNDRGEYVEAEKLLRRAIEIHDKAHRRDDPYTATVIVNLGILLTNLERYEEAGPLFERAAYIQDTMLRPDHPDVAVRLHATAAWLHATGKPAEAVKLATRAEAIRDKQAAAGNTY